MKVVESREDQSLSFGHLLDLVCPLARNLDGRLYRLSTGVHGKHHVIAEQLLHLLRPDGEDVVVECARGQGQPPSLLSEGLDQLRVTMALVHGTVCGQEVEVVLSLGIPDIDALGLGEDDGKRVVVVGGEFVFGSDGRLGGCGMVARGTMAVAVGRDAVVSVRRHVGRGRSVEGGGQR